MFDPGHGGTDPGAQANGLVEKQLNLQTAQLAATALKARCKGLVDRRGQPVEVQLTRDDDRSLTPAERLRRISMFNPDICISVHYNAAPSADASGTEIFHSAKDNRDDELAQLLIKHLSATGMPSRGVRTRTASSGEDYYYIIRDVMDADTVAVLYEGAFLTNEEDAKRIKAGWVNQADWAIASAVFEFISPQLRKVETAKSKGPAVVFEGKTYPAKIIEGTTWTPVRAVAEAAGLRVDYDAKTQITTLKR